MQSFSARRNRQHSEKMSLPYDSQRGNLPKFTDTVQNLLAFMAPECFAYGSTRRYACVKSCCRNANIMVEGRLVMLTSTFRVGALALALVGCTSTAPLVEAFPESSQYKVEAAKHWDNFASEAADHIASVLKGGTQAAVYLQKSERPTAFDKAFEAMLTTRLVNHGIAVTHEKRDSLVLKYQAQVVTHKDRAAPFGVPPATEAVISVGMSNGYHYTARKTGIFYVNEGDAWHYTKSAAGTRTLHVVAQ